MEMIQFEPRCMVGIDRSSAVIPEKILRRRDELWSATMRSLELNLQGDQTLLHHDVHIGNWYKTAKGCMGLGDWQTQVRGNWACDFSYAVSCALTVEDRRAWERDLLKHYLEKLKEFGVAEAPGFDAAWLLYRQQFFHGFVFWVFTIGRGALQPKMQPDQFSLINIERFTNAMSDHDSIDSLRQ
jgi:aminoglycoside phosphotransferase (APT) family kinase protein